MQYSVHKLTKNATIITFIIVFFSCEDNTALLMQINTFNENPVGTAYNIRMTYTDSASIKAKLSAPVHLDYSHLSFKYSEFPEGLKVIFFNQEMQENTVFADYGILYNQTKIVDLKGNVVLLSHDGSRLETSQMYCIGMQKKNGFLPKNLLFFKIVIIIWLLID